VALMIKIPLLLRNIFFHVSDTVTQPVLGKFPIKVKISMTISNSVIFIRLLLQIKILCGSARKQFFRNKS
jgi:hypothetical protein